ncbi:MAG: hypothetical protein P4L84_24060 [Isosphaeraceae bacterium]|nr:hypothetical protein [Isosphaeraceae bacterium]
MAHDAEVYTQEGSRNAGQPPHGAVNEAPPGPDPAAAAAPAPGAPSLLLMAGGSILALVFGMIGACLSLNLFENSSQAASPGTHPAPVTRPDRESDVKALKTQVEALAQRIDGLKDRLDALPKGEPTAGLAMLQVQVADLTKAAREASPLPVQIDKVNQQLGQLSQDILSLRREIGDVQLRLGKADPAPVSLPSAEVPKFSPENPPAAEPPPVVEIPKADASSADVDETQWKRAVGLFKKGKFKDALEAFDKLELTRPDDARVWYYAALSRGFATNQWTDGTEDLAEKGVEREQAGTPATTEIDRAFRDLTTVTGKDWLAAYRVRAKKE